MFHTKYAGVGVDVSNNCDADRFKKKYNLDNYVIYVGRIDEGKDCPRLFNYFMEYKKRNKNNLKLVLMGKAVCEIPKHPDIISLGFVTDEDKFDGIAVLRHLYFHLSSRVFQFQILRSYDIIKASYS